MMRGQYIRFPVDRLIPRSVLELLSPDRDVEETLEPATNRHAPQPHDFLPQVELLLGVALARRQIGANRSEFELELLVRNGVTEAL